MSAAHRTLALLRCRTSLSIPVRTFTSTRSALATQDYGSGDGHPKGEKPQEQGPNPSADKEHPGPPPPKAGQGTGGGPTKADSTGHNTGEAQQQKRGYSTLSKRTTPSIPHQQLRTFNTSHNLRAESAVGKPKGDITNAQPKILNEDPPAEDATPEVKAHNEDMARRADTASNRVSNAEASKDKVHSEFWKGEGGKVKGETIEKTG